MNILRKLTLALCKTIMVACVIAFLGGMIFIAVGTKPTQIKGWLNESGLYNVATQSVKDQFIQSTDPETAKNPIIQNSINQSIKESTLQTFAESGIDQTYQWLDGKTKTPEFSLDIQKIKEDFANNVAAGLLERSKTLPTCTYRNLPTTSDIFAVNCIPPGTDINAEIEKARQEILKVDTSDASVQTVLSAKDMKVQTNNGDQPYYQAYSSAPTYYKLLKVLPILSALVFLLMAGIVVLLSRPRYLALRTIGGVTVPYGIMYILAGYFLPNTIKNLINSFFKSGSDTDIGPALQKIAGHIAGITGSYLTRIGIVLVVVGFASFAAYFIIKRNNTPPKTEDKDKPSETKKSISQDTQQSNNNRA